jgi:hypothetical protein
MKSLINPAIGPRPGYRRRLITVALTASLFLAAVAVSPIASATGIDAECLGSFSRSFDPPLTLTSQTTTVTGTNFYATCVIGPTATGAETVTLGQGCLTLVTVGSATAGPAITETVTWSDTGDTSTIGWSIPTIVAQTVVYTGTVIAGRDIGDTATKITSGTSYLGSSVGCLLGTPISTTTGLIDSLLLTN